MGSSSPAPSPARYRGRFAPSPTGPLHFGSITTAVGSYLTARQAGGEWHVRIDDLDRTRQVPGAADAILRTLEVLGFEWHGPVWYQSQNDPAYAAALTELQAQGLVFECSCSRRELQQLPENQIDPSIDLEELRYPGLCRNGPLAADRGTAVRFRVPDGIVAFEDALQGRIAHDVQQESGDFVVRRRDGLHAYQLACAVDDHEQGFTHIVRGADLLASTTRQLLLQRALRYPAPLYAHLPVMIDPTGRKLSKSSAAPAAHAKQASTLLWQALECLQQDPPEWLRAADTREIWAWALRHWTLEPLKGRRHVEVRTPNINGAQ